MKSLSTWAAVPALVGMLGASVAAQAFVVSQGVEDETFVASSFDEDEAPFELEAGSYTLSLLVNDFFGDGGASGFIITNTEVPEEVFKVTLTQSGLAQSLFTTVGGWFAWNVAGVVGTLTSYTAAVEESAPVPLPPSVMMLGSAAAAMFSIRRRGGKTEVAG